MKRLIIALSIIALLGVIFPGLPTKTQLQLQVHWIRQYSCSADAEDNGVVNVLDMTKLARIILGLD